MGLKHEGSEAWIMACTFDVHCTYDYLESEELQATGMKTLKGFSGKRACDVQAPSAFLSVAAPSYAAVFLALGFSCPLCCKG